MRREDTKTTPQAKIELMVNLTQLAAVRFYERHGFVIVETLKDQLLGDGKMYDEYLMRKEN
jgi:ribosomal protein S18 acetylase RimI-like enzyme